MLALDIWEIFLGIWESMIVSLRNRRVGGYRVIAWGKRESKTIPVRVEHCGSEFWNEELVARSAFLE